MFIPAASNLHVLICMIYVMVFFVFMIGITFGRRNILIKSRFLYISVLHWVYHTSVNMVNWVIVGLNDGILPIQYKELSTYKDCWSFINPMENENTFKKCNVFIQ